MASLTHPTIDVLPVVAQHRSRRTRIVLLIVGLLGLVVVAGVVLVTTMGFTCG